MGLIARRRRWRSRKPSLETSPEQALRRKFTVLYVLVLIAFASLSLQLLRLQVFSYGEYRDVAARNFVRTEHIPPPRGLIYDRNGKLLAQNVAAFSVSVIPAGLPKGHENDVYSALQELVQVPAFEIERQVNEARRKRDPFTPILVKQGISQELALILRERQLALPGVEVTNDTVRYYPAGPLTSHILGYVGKLSDAEYKELRDKNYEANDVIGKAGVETQYESYLRGYPGSRDVEVDAAGQRQCRVQTIEDPTKTDPCALREDPPSPGNNLVLSIDLDLQRAVYDILSESVRDLASKQAVALVMDVRTGELLADVSLPSYDNNVFSHTLDEQQYATLTNERGDKPLIDRAIAEQYAPGSTFKIVTGLAALQEGVATPNTTIVSTGKLLVPHDYDSGSDVFPDWRPGLGPLSFYQGVANSSDIYFYCLAGGNCPDLKNGLNSDRLARYARAFGFDKKTGIDLPLEADGLIGDAEWLKKATRGAQNWFLADTFYMGIGQGYVQATPLQVVRMVAALANGGTLVRPRVTHDIRDADGQSEGLPHTDPAKKMPVDEANLSVMREAMRQAVAGGTASPAQVPGVTVAGKTGTAEFGQRQGAGSVYGAYDEHGWFVGFAPFEQPEIAVLVFHYKGGGALTAAPTAGRIFKAYFDLKQTRSARTPGATP